MATKQDPDFAKAFIHFCRHKTFATVMDDFLTIVLCCLARGAQEERYLDTIARYTTEEVKNDFPRLLGLLHMHYLEKVTADGKWSDPLGEMWMLYSSTTGQKIAGEFYTPNELCDVMASLTITDQQPTSEISVLDPAAGSGRTLLAAGRLSPAVNIWLRATAVDINRITCKMCAVNLFYHGISGRVIHGDTLALKAWGGYIVRPLLGLVTFVGVDVATGWLVPVKQALQDNTPPAPQKPSRAHPVGPQLRLF